MESTSENGGTFKAILTDFARTINRNLNGLTRFCKIIHMFHISRAWGLIQFNVCNPRGFTFTLSFFLVTEAEVAYKTLCSMKKHDEVKGIIDTSICIIKGDGFTPVGLCLSIALSVAAIT
jgi:hypothetical protein